MLIYTQESTLTPLGDLWLMSAVVDEDSGDRLARATTIVSSLELTQFIGRDEALLRILDRHSDDLAAFMAKHYPHL